MITNAGSGTSVHEVGKGIYRISTPLAAVPGGFSFNQYLVADDEPLLFHTGGRRLFPLVREAIETVMPVSRLRHIAFSHFESDECGALNDLLAVAPDAVPLCSDIAAMVSVSDFADREPRGMADGATLSTGARTFRWLSAPHVPHAWENGFLFDESTKTLFCGDLFTQPGVGDVALTSDDILEPSEAMRGGLDYYSHSRNARPVLDRLASLEPRLLACMHGSAWEGAGGPLLRALTDRLGA